MYSFYQHPDFGRIKDPSRSVNGSTADAGRLLDGDEHFRLCRLVERFANIETLVLPSVCDDAIFYVVATSCKRYDLYRIQIEGNRADFP